MSPPWGRRGFKSRIRPPYPQRVANILNSLVVQIHTYNIKTEKAYKIGITTPHPLTSVDSLDLIAHFCNIQFRLRGGIGGPPPR